MLTHACLHTTTQTSKSPTENIKAEDKLHKYTETAYLRVVLTVLKHKLTFGYTWSRRKKNTISDAEM
jgi:hypothetical protein